MQIPDIIIEVDGGMVQDVRVKDKALTAKVIDHDLTERLDDVDDEDVRIAENARILAEAEKQGYHSIY